MLISISFPVPFVCEMAILLGVKYLVHAFLKYLVILLECILVLVILGLYSEVQSMLLNIHNYFKKIFLIPERFSYIRILHLRVLLL